MCSSQNTFFSDCKSAYGSKIYISLDCLIVIIVGFLFTLMHKYAGILVDFQGWFLICRTTYVWSITPVFVRNFQSINYIHWTSCNMKLKINCTEASIRKRCLICWVNNCTYRVVGWSRTFTNQAHFCKNMPFSFQLIHRTA